MNAEALTEYAECRFEGVRVQLDGCRFVRCTFINCEVAYSGGPIELVSNTFAGCHWAFEGTAGDTLAFVAALCRNSGEFSMMVARMLGFVHENAN